MDKVEIYDGVTEEELLQEIDEVKKDYNKSSKFYKRQQMITGFGIVITTLNFVSLCNFISSKSLFTLIHGGYSIICCDMLNKNLKDLKNIKEKNKSLRLKLNSLEEKLPIETDCVVR